MTHLRTYVCSFLRLTWLVVACVCLIAGVSEAQQSSLAGRVEDPLGSGVGGARVQVSTGDQVVAVVTTETDGRYVATGLAPGRHVVVVEAGGFESARREVVVGRGQTYATVTLAVGPVYQSVVVTAAADVVHQAQTGAPVSRVERATLEAFSLVDVQDAVRMMPGVHAVQAGARGGTTSIFIRGGEGSFNKVLVDGVAVNDIGGAFDVAQATTVGVEAVEILRQPNSVVYGTDALAGVVSLTTRRGATRVPELVYQAGVGSLGTWSTGADVGGAAGRVNYYSGYTGASTDNQVPNNRYRNGTYAGRLDVVLGGRTQLTTTLRRVDTSFGSPGAFGILGVADDSRQTNALTYGSVSAVSQWSDRWQSTIRFGVTDQTLRFSNPSPTGEAFDPFGFGANYLGRPVTLRAADGTTVSGRAILDFGGTYPSTFASRMSRHVLSGQVTLQATPLVAVSAGARVERERAFSDPDGAPSAGRTNGGAFAEARLALNSRVYANAGLGFEHNGAFGDAVTPRASAAVYLREPSASGVGDSKLVANVSAGIKAPSVFQAESSLYALVKDTAAGAGVEPVGPERSRSWDIGLEQGLAGNRARVRAAYFRNRYSNLLEYLSRAALPRAGVSEAVAAATTFGAYVNSQSFRAQGVELSIDTVLGRGLRASGAYTYLDAVVTRALSASVSENPAIPGVAIGAFSPLVGARPFRRPTHAGQVQMSYTAGPAQVALAGYLSGARDDSTFATDAFFGNSLLLPNRDLAGAYAKFDVSGTYRVRPRIETLVAVENIANTSYQAVFGFPSLPRVVRFGVRVAVGGDSRPSRP